MRVVKSSSFVCGAYSISFCIVSMSAFFNIYGLVYMFDVI